MVLFFNGSLSVVGLFPLIGRENLSTVTFLLNCPEFSVLDDSLFIGVISKALFTENLERSAYQQHFLDISFG